MDGRLRCKKSIGANLLKGLDMIYLGRAISMFALFCVAIAAADEGNGPPRETGEKLRSFGDAYYEGQNGPVNYVEAAKHYKRAAEMGDRAAQLKLSAMYLDGRGVPQDVMEGRRLLEEIANKGYSDAQTALGFYYLDISTTHFDSDEAIRWFRRAAEEGDIAAQSLLGQAFIDGSWGTTEKDHAEGARWILAAAMQGGLRAQLLACKIHYEGIGVKKDPVKSYAWANVAAANGNIVAKRARKELRDEMTPEQIAEAQKLSRELFEEIQERAAAIN